MVRRIVALGALGPGVLLCTLVALLAGALGEAEAWATGRAWLEPLVLAILLGMALGNAVELSERFRPGIAFSAKMLLDIAVALLGATLSIEALRTLGLSALLLIALLVVLALGTSFVICRWIGLNRRLAILIAAGNAICGNSAIAAVAPVVGADEDDIAAAISLTALVGVAVVLLLPLAVYLFHLPVPRYALLAGLTVYAVPQVIAAAAPFGASTVTLATFVKLARVLMLGPLTVLLSLLAPAFTPAREDAQPAPRRGPGLILPWFIAAFLLLAAVRWTGLMPLALAGLLGTLSNLLAVVAMAALGLGVRLRVMALVGPKVALATLLTTALILLLAGGLVQLL